LQFQARPVAACVRIQGEHVVRAAGVAEIQIYDPERGSQRRENFSACGHAEGHLRDDRMGGGCGHGRDLAVHEIFRPVTSKPHGQLVILIGLIGIATSKHAEVQKRREHLLIVHDAGQAHDFILALIEGAQEHIAGADRAASENEGVAGNDVFSARLCKGYQRVQRLIRGDCEMTGKAAGQIGQLRVIKQSPKRQ